MNISKKYFLHFAWVFVVSLLLATASPATTTFHLTTTNAVHDIECDYLEIDNNQVMCTANNLLITYDLTKVTSVKVMSPDKSYYTQRFTPETITKINSLNYEKLSGTKATHAETSPLSATAHHLSLDSFQEFFQSLKKRYTNQIATSTLHLILVGAGVVLFVIGGIWYIIETFRTGIVWGLSCLFLPLVSLIFLFVHWKVAARPFLVSMLGIALLVSGTLFVPASEAIPNIHTSLSTQRVIKKATSGTYQCKGKVYCSEMTSCAEAKFYLRNCPGTKMDGNHDGIPCEKQWCNE
nr:excalibur calcium-binding domain-containing protein [Desulfogranum marinum]